MSHDEVVKHIKKGMDHMKITTLGIDIAKSVFHLYGVNKTGRLVKKNMLKRQQLMSHIARLEPCTIAMEACGGANYWAREFNKLGHKVVLIAPQYVSPYRKGNKNDFNDAEAIAEAAQRPNMRFAPIKSIEQQDVQILHRMRERLVKQRTSLTNQTRGLLVEFGIVMAKGKAAFKVRMPEILEDRDKQLTAFSRELFTELYNEFTELEVKFNRCEKKIAKEAKDNAICQRLHGILGVGPVTATALYAAVGDGKEFTNGRHLAAWCGLVPRQNSSGGKNTLQGISKRGNTYLRTLLIHGARAVLQHATKKTDRFSLWAKALEERRGFNRACVAIANKLARIAWVVMAREEEYKLTM
jgi:transposase